jgi:hypothetical protein
MIEVNDVHPTNAASPIEEQLLFDSNTKPLRDVQLLKASYPIVVILLGRMIEVSDVHPANAPIPIEEQLLLGSNTNPLRDVQLKKV